MKNRNEVRTSWQWEGGREGQSGRYSFICLVLTAVETVLGREPGEEVSYFSDIIKWIGNHSEAYFGILEKGIKEKR